MRQRIGREEGRGEITRELYWKSHFDIGDILNTNVEEKNFEIKFRIFSLM